MLRLLGTLVFIFCATTTRATEVEGSIVDFQTLMQMTPENRSGYLDELGSALDEFQDLANADLPELKEEVGYFRHFNALFESEAYAAVPVNNTSKCTGMLFDGRDGLCHFSLKAGKYAGLTCEKKAAHGIVKCTWDPNPTRKKRTQMSLADLHNILAEQDVKSNGAQPAADANAGAPKEETAKPVKSTRKGLLADVDAAPAPKEDKAPPAASAPAAPVSTSGPVTTITNTTINKNNNGAPTPQPPPQLDNTMQSNPPAPIAPVTTTCPAGATFVEGSCQMSVTQQQLDQYKKQGLFEDMPCEKDSAKFSCKFSPDDYDKKGKSRRKHTKPAKPKEEPPKENSENGSCKPVAKKCEKLTTDELKEYTDNKMHDQDMKCLYSGVLSKYRKNRPAQNQCRPVPSLTLHGKKYVCKNGTVCNPLVFGVNKETHEPFCSGFGSNATDWCSHHSMAQKDVESQMKDLGIREDWEKFRKDIKSFCGSDKLEAKVNCAACGILMKRMWNAEVRATSPSRTCQRARAPKGPPADENNAPAEKDPADATK